MRGGACLGPPLPCCSASRLSGSPSTLPGKEGGPKGGPVAPPGELVQRRCRGSSSLATAS